MGSSIVPRHHDLFTLCSMKGTFRTSTGFRKSYGSFFASLLETAPFPNLCEKDELQQVVDVFLVPRRDKRLEMLDDLGMRCYRYCDPVVVLFDQLEDTSLPSFLRQPHRFYLCFCLV
ncbi:hypothetical protein FOPG_04490 [Fusarium oxysporum f. sp. conglutinans race 2 54008]|uniref:Uncharacterized protein n=1 Tax=Fusarium oxysporum f. sp. conglutinans race 2 54008 TaxID=1089457 RepID=X0IFI6_FUSOX|nr:hypothetical protein FOPG_04490 [Fusarium oxysporum f. sp. conglutinans race 2 54008]